MKIDIINFLYMIKKKFFLGFVCLLAAAMIPMATKAFSTKTGTSVYVAENETINGNLFAGGQTITIEGKVTGDVICGGQVININGIVEGDVICGGETININGTVNGNVRVAGSSINVNGKIARNAMLFGSSVYLGSSSSVGWDVFMAGATGEIRGDIGRGLKGAAASVVISGEIGDDVSLELDRSDKNTLTLEQGAKIGGNLDYTAGKEASIDANAKVTGSVVYNPKTKFVKKPASLMRFWLWGSIYSILAAIAIGLALVLLMKDKVKKITDRMISRIGSSIGMGAIIMFLTPIAFILLLMTIIGIPLGFILLGILIISFCIGRILAAIAIGRIWFSKFLPKKKVSLIWPMISGIILSWIIFSIPFLGWMFSLAAMWWGLGGLWMQCKKS